MSCPDCFKGHLHDGTPNGKVETIHGLQTYVATPPEGVTPKGIIVYIPDAFGWDFVNNRILSDNYAEKGGFIVYLPDFMNGSAVPFSVMGLLEDKVMKPTNWFKTIFYKPVWIVQVASKVIPFLFRNRASVAKPRVFAFVQALRTSTPPFPTSNLKIGAAGFCWGGRYAIHLAADTPSSRVIRHKSQAASQAPEPLIDCAFTAHPSMVSMPKDIEEVTIPLSVAVGDNDSAMGGQLVEQMKEILEQKKDEHEIVIMPGAKHGFGVRTDMKDTLQMGYSDKAEVQAIEWFSRWAA